MLISVRSSKIKLAIVGLSLFAVAGQAGTIFNFSGTVAGDAESASANFILSNCVTVPSTSCQLDVVITNNVSNPGDIGFGIMGLSFNIASLTSGGTLLTSGGVAAVTDGSGGKVNSVDFTTSPVTITQTNLAPNWSFGYSTGSASGCLASNVFCLNGHTGGGKPTNLIIGGGPYTNANGSFDPGGHTPDLAGPIDFEIDNFAGLTTGTIFTNVQMDFGTGPDGSITCIAGASCTTTQTIPEPISLLLTGSGLLGLGLFRKRLTR